MIYEFRTYDLKVGRTNEYLGIFETRGVEVISRYAKPFGFWFNGATGTGRADQVNHIWGYESVEHRQKQRSALYADPFWTRDLVPLVFDTFEVINGRLMTLDTAFEPALQKSFAAPEPRGPMVARFGPAGASLPGEGALARFSFFTGAVGETLSLTYLADADMPGFSGPAGTRQELWHPARFSRLR
jgi:hypothetical protein